MSKIKRLLLSALTATLVVGCGPSMKTVKTVWYELDAATPSPQSKNDVTISVESVSAKNYKNYPELAVRRESLPESVLLDPNSATRTSIRGSWDAISMADKNGIIWWIPTGGGITGFHATIKNNTAHILRMGDARIYYIVSGKPIPAIKSADYGLNSTNLVYREVSKVAARQMKFINDVDTEILPGFEYSGYLVFPIDPDNAIEGELKFFDITTKVDNTGAPVEKTSYSFRLTRQEETKTYKVGFASVEEVK